MKIKPYFFIFLFVLFTIFSIQSIAYASYQVKGKGVTNVIYTGGKAITSKINDEVVYVVDLQNKKVTRTGVFNSEIKNGPFAGLQPDNTEYQIVYDRMEDIITRDKGKKPQHIIKAIGHTGAFDGYETVVIGEDFITTSNSKFDYFSLYYYNIIKEYK